MRLWTVHPKYLDSRGLVALWREALLAKAVLQGKTKGYRHHPQLERFRNHPAPSLAISSYLAAVHEEATSRGYIFDQSKIGLIRSISQIAANEGQLSFEWHHLLRKLFERAPKLYQQGCSIASPKPHPLFTLRPGPMEPWERIETLLNNQ